MGMAYQTEKLIVLVILEHDTIPNRQPDRQQANRKFDSIVCWDCTKPSKRRVSRILKILARQAKKWEKTSKNVSQY